MVLILNLRLRKAMEPVISRSSTASSIVSNYAELPTIHMLAWGKGSLAHWALFVPNRPGSPIGRIIHIGVNANSSGFASTTVPEYQRHGFRVTGSAASRCFDIPDARATLAQVEEAARFVSDGYTYNIATANCQNFAMDVLIRLNHLYPSTVTAAAIQQVRLRGTVSTFLARYTRRTPIAYPQSRSRPPPRGFILD
ncbi:hypothetical protein NUU61_008512 [Penicillium alfredii]|uniref:PPPDE domain-containing protein n=1 Tax=Penicillium alfredii TaxID=1506179 RepID=A0A9W9ELB4_9EURO|nr:uncharacterized protein NUU61_008512 [Penicillium alfredii]KAJ5083933.1 hypothetical protein NUU61_008512 [Penicillium alfredii]